MEDYRLVRPEAAYADQIAQLRREFLEEGGSMDGMGPLRRMEDPIEYIRFCREQEEPAYVPGHLVPATQFLFLRSCDDQLLGMIQVRHCFNDYLEKYAGHIGYSIRPRERRRGYAKQMLRMTLPYCRELGLRRVLITCIDGNIASEKTILANDGVYESTVWEPNSGRSLKRFWIELE